MLVAKKRLVELLLDLLLDLWILEVEVGLLYEAKGICQYRYLFDSFVGGLRVSIENVFLDGLVEEEWFLHHEANLLSKICYPIHIYVNSVNGNRARNLVVKAEQQRSNGAFAATGMTD